MAAQEQIEGAITAAVQQATAACEQRQVLWAQEVHNLRHAGRRLLKATLARNERACSAQLYHMLIALCKCAALARIVNTGAREGLEAWRSIVEAREPSTLSRTACLLQEIVSGSFEGDITGRIARYEHDAGRYPKTSGETLPPTIRIVVAFRMVLEGRL